MRVFYAIWTKNWCSMLMDITHPSLNDKQTKSVEIFTDLDLFPQLFSEHDVLHRRLGKSLYYGGSDSTSVDSLSLPLTQLCVDHFNKAAPASTSSSPGSNAKAGIQLDMAQASNVAR